MQFGGTQAIRVDNSTGSSYPVTHMTAPYSFEIEFFMNSGDNRWIATNGEGFQAGWPEWSIIVSGGALVYNSSSTNNGNTTSATFLSSINFNQWYRVGFMFYLDSQSKPRVRGFVNDVQKFDVETTEPYDSPNGIAIGNDFTRGNNRGFLGRIRNVWLANSLFWTV